MQTNLDVTASRRSDTTADDELSNLDFEGRAVFERVRERLGLGDGGGRTVGRFELGQMLGSGGMGTVFLARDPKLNRAVAIKLVHTRSLASPARLRARLIREGQALAKLQHPNVVSVHELGEHDGEVFLAMEYVAGATLRDLQEREDVSQTTVLETYISAGRGLAAAHQAGIVHRDFKPDNVFISEDGRVQVGDFGLAIADETTDSSVEPNGGKTPSEPGASERLTQAGEILGTLGYMSPEQVRGEPATPRSDQYAYCVSLWEGLSGALPFTGSNRAELLAGMSEGRIHGGEKLPGWVRAALTKGLSADPAARHENMDSLVRALERGLSRRGRQLRGGAFMLAGLTTLTSLIYAGAGEDDPPCELAIAIEDVRGLDSWESARESLSLAGADDGLRRLEARLVELGDQADRVCASNQPLTEAHLRAWVDRLGRLVETADKRPLERVLVEVEELGRAQFDRPPPRPVSDAVFDLLDASMEQELRNDLSLALKLATEAYEEESQTSVDRAVALLRVARVRAIQGDHEDALVAYESARHLADSAEHDDARLRANLGAAAVAIKRLEDLDKGEFYLGDAQALLERLDEPYASPRRADYYDLRANSAKRRGDLDLALNYELCAVLRHAWVGDRRLLARVLLNLGTIFDYRSQPVWAGRCYRAALARLAEGDPDRYQITLNLGRWLDENGRDDNDAQEARSLLRETIAGRAELRVEATTTLLMVELQAEELDTDTVRELIEQLVALLDGDAPATPMHKFSAWRMLTFAYASVAEYGPPFDRAVEAVEARAPNQIELAQAELVLGELLLDQPERARAPIERAVARLERLPAARERDAVLDRARADLAELGMPASDL